MLRALLDDHTLASDVVPYVEQAFVLALTGLRSRRWAIRNVCGLLYAALTRRVFGNSRAREETKYDGITGRELFTRFPGLHPFLTNQLEDAVDRMAEIDTMQETQQLAAGDGGVIEVTDDEGDAGQRVSNSPLPMGAVDPVSAVLRSGARFIHPSLYPCLILLARLQPSLADTSHASEGTTDKHDSAAEAAGVVATSPHSESATGAVAPPMNLDREPLTRVNERNSTVHVTSASTMLSMYSFTELVETCIDSPVFKTREMAARAFAALVPSERAAATVVALLRSMREAGANAAANMYHGTLCQVHELLRVHWHRGGDDDGMRRAFVTQIFPALTALWPVLVQSVDRYSGSEDTFDPTDVVRHKYLVIVNEFVARGESWILPGLGDAALARTTRLLLSRFRLTMLYGTLHPVLSSGHVLAQAGTPQTPGAFGTVLELMRLFLACVDDCAMAVLRDDGAVQLQIDGDVFDEHGANMSPVPAGDPSEVLYNPWPVLGSVLANNDFYEAKLLALEWMLDHAQNGRMDVFERMGIDNLLAYLIADSHAPVVAQNDSAELQPSRDPLVRAAAIRLLARLCTKLDIDARTLPVRDMLSYWDDIVGQLAAQFCPLSVATALVELQAALVHLLLQYPDAQDTAMINEVNRRMFAWAQQIYSWTDPERAVPYRHAVSRALITYSAIKRYIEAGSSNHLPTAPVDAPSEEIMRLCYWRLLQDDDADIREFIAHNISQRLGRELACDQACEKLVLDFRPPADSPFPATYVQNRLEYILGVSSGESVADRVELAINPDRALFVHENPNIYIDEPRNVQLAYYSLVTMADIFAGSQPQHVTEMARQSFGCVEALETAHRVLIKSRKLALERGVVLGGVLGVTSLSSLFELLQSWILGARLVLFAAARLDDRDEALKMTERVAQVVDLWLTSSELQPLHPWIARALNRLCNMAAMNQEPMSIDNAVSDLFLLTYV
ncbi:hypothetical protein IWW51_000996 [Coemansia sp. RSA 2702]|nr:hypothetical protein IWW51_000996 [Coemansia sp. RSA 2702]